MFSTRRIGCAFSKRTVTGRLIFGSPSEKDLARDANKAASGPRFFRARSCPSASIQPQSLPRAMGIKDDEHQQQRDVLQLIAQIPPCRSAGGKIPGSKYELDHKEHADN